MLLASASRLSVRSRAGYTCGVLAAKAVGEPGTRYPGTGCTACIGLARRRRLGMRAATGRRAIHQDAGTVGAPQRADHRDRPSALKCSTDSLTAISFDGVAPGMALNRGTVCHLLRTAFSVPEPRPQAPDGAGRPKFRYPHRSSMQPSLPDQEIPSACHGPR